VAKFFPTSGGGGGAGIGSLDLQNFVDLQGQTIIYYVRSTGSDASGDGSLAFPFQTWKGAITKIPKDFINGTFYIDLTDTDIVQQVVIPQYRSNKTPYTLVPDALRALYPGLFYEGAVNFVAQPTTVVDLTADWGAALPTAAPTAFGHGTFTFTGKTWTTDEHRGRFFVVQANYVPTGELFTFVALIRNNSAEDLDLAEQVSSSLPDPAAPEFWDNVVAKIVDTSAVLRRDPLAVAFVYDQPGPLVVADQLTPIGIAGIRVTSQVDDNSTSLAVKVFQLNDSNDNYIGMIRISSDGRIEAWGGNAFIRYLSLVPSTAGEVAGGGWLRLAGGSVRLEGVVADNEGLYLGSEVNGVGGYLEMRLFDLALPPDFSGGPWHTGAKIGEGTFESGGYTLKVEAALVYLDSVDLGGSVLEVDRGGSVFATYCVSSVVGQPAVRIKNGVADVINCAMVSDVSDYSIGPSGATSGDWDIPGSDNIYQDGGAVLRVHVQ